MAKTIDIKTVIQITHLANLSLTPQQKYKFTSELSEILNYVNALEKVDTSNIEPTFNVTGLENVFREDEVSDSLSQEEALQNAQDKNKGFIKTKGIFQDE